MLILWDVVAVTQKGCRIFDFALQWVDMTDALKAFVGGDFALALCKWCLYKKYQCMWCGFDSCLPHFGKFLFVRWFVMRTLCFSVWNTILPGWINCCFIVTLVLGGQMFVERFSVWSTVHGMNGRCEMHSRTSYSPICCFRTGNWIAIVPVKVGFLRQCKG